MRTALKVISAVVLSCALAFVAWEVCKVRNIEVIGYESTNADYIISLSGLKYGESVFTLDNEKVMELLARDPYIEPLSVKILYPDSVEITVKQREQAAYIEKDGNVLIIDDECWLLRIVPDDGSAPCPLVVGLNLDELKVGERLGDRDTFRLDVLSRVLKAAKENGMELESVDMSVAADVTLKLKSGFTVELGDDTELQKKFSLVKASVSELQNMGKTGGIIDVASAEKAYYR